MLLIEARPVGVASGTRLSLEAACAHARVALSRQVRCHAPVRAPASRWVACIHLRHVLGRGTGGTLQAARMKDTVLSRRQRRRRKWGGGGNECHTALHRGRAPHPPPSQHARQPSALSTLLLTYWVWWAVRSVLEMGPNLRRAAQCCILMPRALRLPPCRRTHPLLHARGAQGTRALESIARGTFVPGHVCAVVPASGVTMRPRGVCTILQIVRGARNFTNKRMSAIRCSRLCVIARLELDV